MPTTKFSIHGKDKMEMSRKSLVVLVFFIWQPSEDIEKKNWYFLEQIV